MATICARAVAARRSAALVRLLGPLDIAAPAVRTAISRMVRQGWLLPVRVAGGPGCQLSVRAVHRLDGAAARIYRTGRPSWDGRFDLVVMTLPEKRTERARITTPMSYLGYGRLDPATWVAPRAADEVDSLLKEAGISFERFTATHASKGPRAPQHWFAEPGTLMRLAEAYGDFVTIQGPAMSVIARHTTDETACAAGSGWCMRGARSCSATRSCPRRCSRPLAGCRGSRLPRPPRGATAARQPTASWSPAFPSEPSVRGRTSMS